MEVDKNQREKERIQKEKELSTPEWKRPMMKAVEQKKIIEQVRQLL